MLKRLSAKSLWNTLAATAMLLASVSAPAGAQAAEKPLPRIFGDSVEVRVVNVEVVVTDRKGVRVEGLGPEDFRLLVDGEEVPIDYFSEITDGAVAAPESRRTAGSVVPSAPSFSAGAVVGTDYLVFIDDYFSVPAFRNAVLRRIAEDVSRLGPGDRMAVMAFDGRRLEMLTDWTSSPTRLQRVFEEARSRQGKGLQRRSERNALEANRRSLRPSRLSQDDIANPAEERHYAERLVDQVERAVDAAAAALRGFGPTPGRSVMLLLSGGWPLSPGDYTVDSLDRQLFSSNRESGDDLSFVRRGSSLYGNLTDTANQLGYTLYPIDVPGVQMDLPDASAGSLRDSTRAGFASSSPRESYLHDTLRYLAAETGGEALLDSARLESLPRVQDDTRSYYWLGFTAERRGDDRGHRIEVELTRPRLKLRFRQNFVDRSQATEMDLAAESALRLGRARGVEDTLAVRFGPPEERGLRKVVLPIEVELPFDDVAVLPVGDRWRVELEVRVVSMNRQGASSEVAVVPLGIWLDAPTVKGGTGLHQIEVELNREPHDVLVAVTDLVTGRFFTSFSEVDP